MEKRKLDKDLYNGFIKLHILYHAAKGKIFGLWIITELRRHGYDLSPGTLYPILHRMEGKGYLKSKKEIVKGKIRRIYSITTLGNNTLSDAKNKVKELFGELFEHDEK